MPSLNTTGGRYNGCVYHIYNRSKPWKARVKKDWVEYFLGYYQTKAEAVQVEELFRATI